MPLKWKRRFIAGEAFEVATAVDVTGNGVLDVVSGAFWYEGPDYQVRHTIADVARHGDYYDDFGAIAIDLDGDSRADIVTGGWFSETLEWRQNHGVDRWESHTIATPGHIELVTAWDVDGDGHLDIVPNTPHGPLVVYRVLRDALGAPTGEFEARMLWDGKQGHGLGFGDVSGSGRGDFVMNHGWLEAPEDRWTQEWIYHPDFTLGDSAGLPVIVADIDGDGVCELIVGNGHGYGLDWWDQESDGSGGRIWTRHPIDPFASQFHALKWVDIDGDGAPELVTGKRWHAHPGDKDPGNDDEVGIYYFKWTGEGFAKHFVDYGPVGEAAGIGLVFDVADLRGTGRLDIIAPGKDGLYVYFNEGL